MHQCLHLPEIVSLICDQISHKTELRNELIVDEPDIRNYMEREPRVDTYAVVQSRSSQLLALAQTCRQLQQPALACLWETLESVIPIFKSAGADLLVKQQSRSKAKWWLLTRPLSSSEAETMKKYAHYVRHLRAYDSPLIHREVWKALRDIFAGTVLFPKLRTITLSDDITEFAPLFGTQHLTDVTLINLNKDNAHRVVQFIAQCPNLAALETHRLAQPEAFFDALPNKSSLSRLSIFTATPTAVLAFSRYSHLRHVSFFLETVSGVDWPLLQEGLHFPMLESININTCSVSDAISLLDTLPAAIELHAFTILSLPAYHEGFLHDKDWLHLLQPLVKYSRSLNKFRLTDCASASVLDNVTLYNDLLSILATHFTALTHLEIRRKGPYNLVDEDVKNLTESLPLLEDFRLFHPMLFEEHFTPMYGTTIACLTFFAQNCPNLSHLAITFDATRNDISAYLTFSHQGLKLTELNVATSLIGDKPDEIAALILRVFPNIRWMNWSSFRQEKWVGLTRAWSKVSQTIKEKGGVMVL